MLFTLHQQATSFPPATHRRYLLTYLLSAVLPCSLPFIHMLYCLSPATYARYLPISFLLPSIFLCFSFHIATFSADLACFTLISLHHLPATTAYLLRTLLATTPYLLRTLPATTPYHVVLLSPCYVHPLPTRYRVRAWCQYIGFWLLEAIRHQSTKLLITMT